MEKVALITGASGGIGRELALIHARQTGDLVIVARSTSKLNTLKETVENEYGRKVVVIPKDLSIPDAGMEVFEEVKSKGIRVDYLVNNAGFGDFGYFHETDWEKEEMMINLNMLTVTHLTKLFGTDMVANKSGYIMNVASTASFLPGPLMTVYYATKHYVLAFTEGIASEWAEFGVKVTALCPGPTDTGFREAAEIEDAKAVFSKDLPSARAVAEFGYDALLRGRTIAVPGAINKLVAGASGFIPSTLARKLMRRIQERKK